MVFPGVFLKKKWSYMSFPGISLQKMWSYVVFPGVVLKKKVELRGFSGNYS